MLTALRKRLDAKNEQGFTLIELLVVIIIIGILLAIAVPTVSGFQDRANKAAAQANVRSAIPSIETFYADNSTYVGLTNPVDGTPADPDGVEQPAGRRPLYDAGLIAQFDAAKNTLNSYCVYYKKGNFEYYKSGPTGVISADTAPADAVHCV